MKAILSYIFILLGLAVLICSSNRDIMYKISEVRNESEAWWGAHQSNDGDLVNMAYLDYAEKFHTKLDYQFTKHPESDSDNRVALYAWGDSYIWKIPDTAYAVGEYHFGWRYRDNLDYIIDTTKTNILLIEIAERYVRTYFSGKDMLNNVKRAQLGSFDMSTRQISYSAFLGMETDDIFNPNINQNLEYNLFNYNLVNPVRQWKAAMNYNLFARASGDVVIADDREYLFLRETVAKGLPESSYSKVSDEELRNIVNNLNDIYNYYINDGFSEIYLSVIPNPATILQPEQYNQLIPSIQSHPHLKMKTLNVYSRYKQTKGVIYRRGDTHWNNNGLQIWLQMVNAELLKYQK